MGITYIPMAGGFAYLACVVDRFTRRVLAFCLAALAEAIARYGAPTIFNTDQGS